MAKLYLDLDGVFADFDKGIKALTGSTPSELGDKAMWDLLKEVPNFYATLELMPGADKMWKAFAPYSPIFLSAVPRPERQTLTAADDKRRWLNEIFGAEVPLITCFAREKANFCTAGDLLLDDRITYAHLWVARDGVFVQHAPNDVPFSIRMVTQHMTTGLRAGIYPQLDPENAND